MTIKNERRAILHSLAEVPAFASEAEEASFWAAHEFSDALMASFTPTPAHLLPPTRTPGTSAAYGVPARHETPDAREFGHRTDVRSILKADTPDIRGVE